MSLKRRDEVRRVRQAVATDDLVTTDVLSSTNTSQDINLSMVASKVSFQRTGDLQCTVTVSLDGVTFTTGATVSSADLVSFNTHNCKVLRVARTNGSGRLVIGATA